MASKAARPVTVIGALPPPMHGAAQITSLVSDHLRARGPVQNFNTAPMGLQRGPAYHLRRIGQVIAAMGKLIAGGFGDGAVYLSAAGNVAVIYDMAVCTVARMMGRRLFIHHHSFAYIDRYSRLRAVLFALAGRTCVHVCLCPRMAEKLQALYGADRRTMVVSNSAFYAPPPPQESKMVGDGLVLGHLSNLSRDKGLDLVLDVFEKCGGATSRLVIAGAPSDGDAVQTMNDAGARLGARLDHRGHVDGDAKARFYADIDVFLFPTRYVNEAEPLAVIEALAAGVPVIAYGRGCIAHMVPAGAGKVVTVGDDFAEEAVNWIGALHADAAALGAARRAAHDGAVTAHRDAGPALQKLLDDLTGA